MGNVWQVNKTSNKHLGTKGACRYYVSNSPWSSSNNLRGLIVSYCMPKNSVYVALRQYSVAKSGHKRQGVPLNTLIYFCIWKCSWKWCLLSLYPWVKVQFLMVPMITSLIICCMGSTIILAVTVLLLKVGMWNLHQSKVQTKLCYTTMQIICIFANLHIYKYVNIVYVPSPVLKYHCLCTFSGT